MFRLSAQELRCPLRAPLLLPLVAFLLGILSANPQHWAAPFLLCLGVLAQFFRRRHRMATSLAIISLFGWLRATVAAEPPLPRSHLNRPRTMDLWVDRCTVKNYKNTQRINGFAKLTALEGWKGPVGQQVYYNLVLERDQPIPHRGKSLHIRAVLHRTNFSADNFERYLSSTGVRHRVDRGKVLAVLPGSPYFLWLSRLYATSSKALQVGLEDESPIGHVYGAMMLGNRSRLSAEEKDIYSRVGIAHLFAVSGLHIGIVAAFLHAFTRRLPVHRFLLLALRLTILFCFVSMVGASPSALRAFSMVAALWSAPLFSRRTNGLSSLVLAALVTLILRPNDIYATGFQFSYTVVFSLLFYGVPLGSLLRNRLLRPSPLFSVPRPTMGRLFSLLSRIWELCALSLAATFPLIPLSIYHFQTFSIGGIFLNPLAIPLAGFAIGCGFASICCGFLHCNAGCLLCNSIATPFLSIICGGAGAIGAFPWIQSAPMEIGFNATLLWTAAVCTAIYCCKYSEKKVLKFFLPAAVAVVPAFIGNFF
ncbi:MAG: ComEC family competence protein [Puniceicoccales bacterium]|nr:ComEC family competence protein [Puniceicoccales bacterium]